MDQNEKIELFVDTDGIMTADPVKVKKAFPIKEISYVEAMEMCHFGAQTIHPVTIQETTETGLI